MSRSLPKSQRLNDVQHQLMIAHAKGGISKDEIAKALDVNRSTIHRDIDDLQEQGVPIYEAEYGRYALDPQYRLFNLTLNPAESLLVYLSMRRTARQMSNVLPTAASTLEKLAVVLRDPMVDRLRTAAEHIAEMHSDPARQQIWETLVRSWVERIAVRIWHRSLYGVQLQQYLLAPYLFEPSLAGEGTYIIGYSDYHKGIVTFKLERIERAALSTEHYELPTNIDADILLRQAWGIWFGENAPVRVVLRFSQFVARRVRENRWHPAEQVQVLPDGRVEWSAEVAEPLEMLPWIRGWGADVEVIEPPELRREMIEHIRRLAQQYGVTQNNPDDPLGLDDTFSEFFGNV